MKRIFIRFEANKMALFPCFASKQISKFYMRNEFRPEANFRLKRIFEAKCSEYFVTELNIAKPNIQVHCHCLLFFPTIHCPLPTVHCPLSTVHCPLFTANCPLFTANCPLFTANCPLFTANCLLSSAHCYCPQFTVHCSLLTVHCLLPTVHYPLFLVSTVY